MPLPLRWADGELRRAEQVLSHSATVVAACRLLSAEFGRNVDPSNFREVFRVAYRKGKVRYGSPAHYIGEAERAAESAPPGAGGPQPTLDGALAAADERRRFAEARAEAIATDAKESAEPGFQPTIPETHRVKGNSTLLGADGAPEAQWVKTERASDEPPAVEAVPLGHHISKVSTLLDGQGNVRAQWIQAPKGAADREAEFWAAAERHVTSYRRLIEPAVFDSTQTLLSDLMTIYGLGDAHIGMLSWAKETGHDFDLKIAERDLVACVDLLVERSPYSEIGMLVNVGDLAHADDDSQLTPTGKNKLDVDSRHGKVIEVILNIMRRLIDRMLTKHRIVKIDNRPGNHDPKMARVINLLLAALYEREPRVVVLPNHNPFNYTLFGRNLIGTCHGEGPRREDLPDIMAADCSPGGFPGCEHMFGSSEHRLWLTGHEHHEKRKDFRTCTVETLRVLCSRDAWHNWKGYRNKQSLSAIVLHSEYGEIDRPTVPLKLARVHAERMAAAKAGDRAAE